MECRRMSPYVAVALSMCRLSTGNRQIECRLSTRPLNTSQHSSTQLNTAQKGRCLLYLKRNKRCLYVYLCRRCPIYVAYRLAYTQRLSAHLNTAQHRPIDTGKGLSTHRPTPCLCVERPCLCVERERQSAAGLCVERPCLCVERERQSAAGLCVERERQSAVC